VGKTLRGKGGRTNSGVGLEGKGAAVQKTEKMSMSSTLGVEMG